MRLVLTLLLAVVLVGVFIMVGALGTPAERPGESGPRTRPGRRRLERRAGGG